MYSFAVAPLCMAVILFSQTAHSIQDGIVRNPIWHRFGLPGKSWPVWWSVKAARLYSAWRQKQRRPSRLPACEYRRPRRPFREC
ncbi:hypothetical protein BJ166DRAFT_514563 [Pestalotiopsis sp. NC0098]|nr:hypothetical protein BJ166DRAFT_514563 [Pestalotiopsis sp. NC0098]